MARAFDTQEWIRALPRLSLQAGEVLRPWLAELRHALGVKNALVYLPEPGDTHWNAAFCEWTGHDWEQREDAYRRYIRGFSAQARDFVAYDPFAVEPAQRNRIMSQLDIEALAPLNQRCHARVLSALGANGEHQLRALICEGPRLIAWFGVLQEEPFQPEQRAALSELIEPLRARLRFRHLAAAGLEGRVLASLLEQIDEPVWIFDARHRVELANGAADALLASGAGKEELQLLRDALASGRPARGYRCTEVCAPGQPTYTLAVAERRARGVNQTVERAAAVWNLPPTLSRSLAYVCEGLTNKEIARRFDCAEVTVERYVTALFRVSGAGTRTELVRKVLEV